MLFLSFGAASDAAFVAGASERRVWLFPTAGGEPRSVPGTELDDVPLRISADGRFLFVSDPPGSRPTRVFRVDLVRGTREPWKELGREGGSPAAFVGALAVMGRATPTPSGTIRRRCTWRRGSGSMPLASGTKLGHVSPDGQWLYVVKPAAPDERGKLHFVTGWFKELRKLVTATR